MLAHLDQHYHQRKLKKIHNRVNKARAEMHELAQHFGLVHELTVAKSQELDVMINEYMSYQFNNATKQVS